MPVTPISAPLPESLIKEIQGFRDQCHDLYKFNSRWDTLLNSLGVVVSVGIVAAGVYKPSELAAMLGGLVTAIVSAQRAFPFNQRWQFYRLMNSQAENLLTETKNGVVTIEQTITTMKAMRLDYAQQIPRGSSFRSDSTNNEIQASSDEKASPQELAK